MRTIGEMAQRVGARVLVDEVYLEMLFDSAPPSAFSLGDTFVVTSSLTKTYGLSGLRCGWILAAPELARRIWRLNDLFAATAAHPAERMSVMAFDHLGQFRERARALLTPIARCSMPFLIRAPIWHVSVRPPARWFFHVCLTANRKHSSSCCARNTKPRSCRVSSLKCRAISGSASAARRRHCKLVWKDWVQPWTNLGSDDRSCSVNQIADSLGQGHSPADDELSNPIPLSFGRRSARDPFSSRSHPGPTLARVGPRSR